MQQLIADATHALRTPLTIVRATIEMHRRSNPGTHTDELTPALEALEALDETVELLNELLLLVRLESLPDRLQARELSCDELASEVCASLASVAHEREIDMSCEAESALVWGERSQLRRAIYNLVDNGLRHTPRGGRICVRVRIVGGVVQLSVEDSGPGLRPDQLERELVGGSPLRARASMSPGTPRVTRLQRRQGLICRAG